jgi:hypothetical protein
VHTHEQADASVGAEPAAEPTTATNEPADEQH